MRNPRSAKQWLTRIYLQVVLVLLVSLSVCVSAQDDATSEALASDRQFLVLVHAIAKASLNARGALIAELSALNHPRGEAVIVALQQGDLFNDRATPPNVGIRIPDDSFVDVLTGNPMSAEMTENLKRIPLNNFLRNQLRTLLAQMNLNHAVATTREQAVLRMVADGIDESTIDVLRARQTIEANQKVLDAITLALAFYNIQSEDSAIRNDAVTVLGTSLQPKARSVLMNIARDDSDKNIRAKAQQAIADIDSRVGVFRLAENIFFGLSLGSVLLLAAIGLAITFGVMGVINMAHGELMMIGAYTTWVIQQAFPNHIGYSLLMAVPAAFMVAGLVGIAIERGVIRFLYGRPLETLLATFGISLVLQQAARSIFSPLNRAVISPDWMSGSLVINPVFSITYNRLYILIFGVVVFFALMVILKKTTLGLKVRAVSQNRAMARAVGVRASWVDAMTFGLGSGVAGIAGVALSQLTNVGPNLGQAYIIDSFMVVVFGGVGNLWGTLVGAMGLGILNKFLEPYAGAVLAKVLVLVLLILFIQKRPKGIFPQKGRAAAD